MMDDKNNTTNRRKPKKTQAENISGVDGRDLFQTPNYAIDLLAPFLENVMPIRKFSIWECAAGEGKIVERLRYCHGFYVTGTDLRDEVPVNFLTSVNPPGRFNCIVTNPPFSLKRKFYEKCVFYKVPFALLIPFDMCGWLWSAFREDGCQGIVPSRRIDYITPTGLSGASGHTAYYHSFWLTRGFNLTNQFEWVELTNEMKKMI